MRPTSIVRFEWLSLLALGIGLVMAVLSWDQSVAVARSGGMGTGFVILVQAFSLAVPLLLILLVSRRASVIAKWVLIVLFLGGLAVMAASPKMTFAEGPLFLVQIAQILLQAIAIALLFTEESRRWFRGGRGDPA
jgi:uncharacterized membrane protein